MSIPFIISIYDDSDLMILSFSMPFELFLLSVITFAFLLMYVTINTYIFVAFNMSLVSISKIGEESDEKKGTLI